MRGFRVYSIVFLALSSAVLYGCGGLPEEVPAASNDGDADSAEMKSPPLAPPSAPASTESPALSGKSTVASPGFSTVLASWSKGNKDGAVQQLLSIRWDEPAIFDDVPHLSLSEDQFRALSLSRDERTRRQKEYMELATTFKNLSRHCFSIGDNARASGDGQTAKAHYEAVLHLGQALSGPNRVSLIQLTGKAIVGAAGEKLAGLNQN